MIHEYLNIELEYCPPLIVLDRENLIVFAKEHVGEFLTSEFLRRTGRMGAFYSSEYDACFVYLGELTLSTQIHETLHGYLIRKNPRFALSEEQRVEHGKTNLEAIFVIMSYEEGLAELGTAETQRRMGNRQEAYEIEQRYLDGMYESDMEKVLKRPGIATAFTKVAQALKSGSRRGPVGYFSRPLAFLKISHAVYPVGFFFAKFALEELMRVGRMRFTHAYNLLTQHVPTTIEEMRNPKAFAQNILAQQTELFSE